MSDGTLERPSSDACDGGLSLDVESTRYDAAVMAALLAAAAEPVPAVPMMEIESGGVILIYGRGEQAKRVPSRHRTFPAPCSRRLREG